MKRIIRGFLRSSARCGLSAALSIALLTWCGPITRALAWTEDDFENRPLIAYPLPAHDDAIGQLESYTIQKGDTLLDVGRWYGLSAKEISDANGHIDWWTPPVGKQVVLPTEHILPSGERRGIILNIPEMRIYYYPVSGGAHHKGKVVKAAYVVGPSVVYSFPVGLGRFDWKTPAGKFTVRGKTRNPTWVVPNDIYQEHLERDGFAEHVVPGGRDDNPLGLYRLELTLPEYALHGTDVPWGVGMTVSHGCVRLYPEDIERLFNKVRIGTPGAFIYEPVKFGFRGDALYVEVHDDLYGRYPGLWNHAAKEAQRRNLTDRVDYAKLEKAVEGKTGIPTYVGLGAEPDTPLGEARAPTSTSPEPIAADLSGRGGASAPAAASAADSPFTAEAPPGRVEDAGGAAPLPGAPTAATVAAPSSAEAAPGRVEDMDVAAPPPKALSPPTVEPAPVGDAGSGRTNDAGDADLESNPPTGSTAGEKGAGVGSDEKRETPPDSGGGLPTGVVEEPEGTQRTPPPPSP